MSINIGMNKESDVNLLPSHYDYVEEPHYEGRGNHNVAQLENLCRNYRERSHQQAIIKQKLISRIKDENNISS